MPSGRSLKQQPGPSRKAGQNGNVQQAGAAPVSVNVLLHPGGEPPESGHRMPVCGITQHGIGEIAKTNTDSGDNVAR